MTSSFAQSVSDDTAIAVKLARRAKLYERQRDGFHRRTIRIASRVGILLFADSLALLAARFGALWLTGHWAGAPAALRTARAVGPLAEPGAPASLVFWLTVIPALLATGAYSRHRGLNASARHAAGLVLAAAAAAVPLAAVVGWPRSVAMMLPITLLTFLPLRLGRLAAEFFLRSIWPRAREAAPAMLIGSADAVTSPVATAVTAGGGDFRIVAHHEIPLPFLAESSNMTDKIDELIESRGVEAIILTESLGDAQLEAVVNHALSVGCLVLSPPRAVELDGLQPRLVWHDDQPLLEFDAPGLQLSALVTKRLMDITGAGAILLFSLPVMLLIAIGVKLDSAGPIFFSQERAGLGGRKFRMLKFRTMRAGADEEKPNLAHLNATGDPRLFKIKGDPRVTRLGVLLRRWSLDELPQLWNVLRGDMSLVGPRPFFEADFAAYEDHHFRRLDTKPGITGLWQVSGRSEVVNFEEVVFLDRQYIEQWSLWLDVSILLRTISAVARRKGAY